MSSILLSVLVVCGLRLTIVGDKLFYIRSEQIFGFLSLFYWYAALIISPLNKVAKGQKWLPHVIFARRAIGVSAAYFALLHVSISLWGQLGGVGGLNLLPGRFIWALGFGFVALIVLLIMASTSLDKVISFMTFRRWKWLHRTGYAAGILVLLHIWIIGTHMGYSIFKIIFFVMLSVLFGLEALRVARSLASRFPKLTFNPFILAVCVWILLSGALLVVPRSIETFHSRHAAGGAHDH